MLQKLIKINIHAFRKGRNTTAGFQSEHQFIIL